jgi:glucose-6-phosphate isomerase
LSVQETLNYIDRQDLVARLWDQDHTIWATNPRGITDQLGWLTIAGEMAGNMNSLSKFANQIQEDEFQDIIVLGMGGSSLVSEVLRSAFPKRKGFPNLTVLDSTIPESIRHIEECLDLNKSLFIIASKSGTTTETLFLYEYFRERMETVVGARKASNHFVAITDQGSALERLANKAGFRQVFISPKNIGGRFSALSYYGLVPAALIGVDIPLLLQKAQDMASSCGPNIPITRNPGAYLGAFLGTHAHTGRDKLTLSTSSSTLGFSLWVEQLIAESTGKEGKGIVPITREPQLPSAAYGNDRVFVDIRTSKEDAPVSFETLKALGHPYQGFILQDTYDLGGEFFRWEFATAIAGALLRINPFNQPSVRNTKLAVKKILANYRVTGDLPRPSCSDSLGNLLSHIKPESYVTIASYLPQSEPVDQAINELRRTIASQYRIATMAGYGPRYLHSTGQLHKQGPDNMLLIELVGKSSSDIQIPRRHYGFRVLTTAQAIGDLQLLRSLGRTAIQIDVGRDYQLGIIRVIESLKKHPSTTIS